MKKRVPSSAFNELLKKIPIPFIALCLMLVSHTAKAQVINETFEESAFSSVGAASSTSGSRILAPTGTTSTVSSTVTYYTAYGQSSATATSINTIANLGTWLYSRASVGTSSNNTKLSRAHSLNNFIGLAANGYIVTPIITNGVASVSFWVTASADFAVGLYTNTTAPSLPTHASTATSITAFTIPTGYTYASQQFFSSSLTSRTGAGTTAVGAAMQLVNYTGTFTGACRLGIFGVNGSLSVDDIVIYTVPPAPSTQASGINFTSVTSVGMTVNWTNGDGNSRAVFVREASAGTIDNPVNNTNYTASSNWSSKGTQLGSSGYYCVYNGTGTSVSLSNLLPSTSYYVQVFEYNGGATAQGGSVPPQYNVTTASNNQATAAPSPTINVAPTSLSFGGQKINTASAEQSYSLSAVFLNTATGNITVTAPTGYEVSATSGSGFGTSINVPYTASTLNATTIYVRFAPTTATVHNANITNDGGGAPTQNVAVSGTGSLYNVGDYMSRATGTWDAFGTWNKWNGSAWVAALTGDFPDAATADVYIDGFTVTAITQSRKCENLYIRNSGILSANTVVNSTRILSVYGSTIQVDDAGSILGNSATGNNADGLLIDYFGTGPTPTLTITGTGGLISISRLRTNTAGTTVIVDHDMTLNYHGSGNAGNATAYYTQAGDNNTLTINSGKTLTFAPWSCFSVSSSSHTSGTFSQTINVNGTMTFTDGLVAGTTAGNPNNGFSGHSNGYMSLAIAAGKTFNLNVGTTGTLNVSEFYPQGTQSNNAAGLGDIVNISVASGGAINTSVYADFRNAAQTVTGAGAFNILSGCTARITSTVGIRAAPAASGPIQTGTRGYSTGANYNYEGATSQATGDGLPATVNNLTLSNPTDVTLSGAVTVAGALAVNNGTLKTSTNTLALDAATGAATFAAGTFLSIDNVGGSANFNGRPVIFRSNATSSAGVLEVKGTLTNASNVSVERFIPSKTARKWSFVTAPVTGTTVRNAWQQQVFVTGAGTGGAAPCAGSTTGDGGGTDKYNSNGFDVSGANSPTIYSYNGAAASGLRWIALPNTSTSLVAGKGYRANIRGTRGTSDANCTNQINTVSPTAPNAVTLSATGTLSTGDVPVTLDGIVGDYTLLGNPYAASIDFDLFNSANTSLGGKYWFYSPENAAAGINSTAYSAYTTGSMTNKPTGYTDANSNNIASGQSFFVQQGAAASVTFMESHKVSAQGGSFRTQTYNWSNAIRAGLKNADGSIRIDEVLVRFGNVAGASKNYTDAWDARSINEGAPVIVSLKGTDRLAIQTRPLNFSDDTVKLGVTISAAGDYRLAFSEYEAFASASVIKLRDKFLNVEQDIRANAVYAFSVTADANSMGDNRFEIVFKSSGALPVNYIGITARNKGLSDVEVNWQLPSETDVKSYEVQRSADSRNFEARGTLQSRGNSITPQSYTFTDAQRLGGISYYRVKATDKSGATNYSPVVKVSNGKEQMTVAIYPNPVKEKLTMLLQNADGAYTIKVSTMEGRTMLVQNGSTVSGNIISINTASLPAGVYMVETMDSKGNRSVEKMVKQ